MSLLIDLGARLVIAHRGASAQAPENTLPAFELAVHQGADALELDVHLSADGVPVVLHDPMLDRTTNRRGPVAALTVTEIQQADAGARFSPDRGRTFPWRGRDVRVPTLAEVVDAFPSLPLLIELKTPAAQTAVRRVLLDLGGGDRCVVAAADPTATESFRAGPWHRGADRVEIAGLYRRALFGRGAGQAGYAFLSVPFRHRGLVVPTRRFIAAAQQIGAPVHVWTVDSPRLAATLWARGAAGIVTNAPERILAAREG